MGVVVSVWHYWGVRGELDSMELYDKNEGDATHGAKENQPNGWGEPKCVGKYGCDVGFLPHESSQPLVHRG